ncbi:MAG: FAD-dependent monooxygenase [Candidatus Acidiferrales bacterium]
MGRTLRVGIIGGGIGGLALAATLAKVGIESRLFERAPAFGEVGAGLQMTPNAVKVIRELGGSDELRKVSFLPRSIVGRNWHSGKVAFRTPLTDECPRLYGAEFLHTHRADLHRILLSLAPSNSTTLSAQCVSVNQSKDTAVATFADHSEFEADLIVGADGIQSTVRKSLFGAEAPRFTGNMCWRMLIPFERPDFDLVSPDASFWLGPQGHVVTYYVSGGRAVNVVAIRETDAWVEESWNIRSNRDELLAGYPNWHPQVLDLFSRAENIFKWGLFDRDPMSTWSAGRLTLLGDAAHPMLPFLSQGAAMAIEDGYVLGAVLAENADPALALKRYEALRLPRTSRVQLESRKRGETYHISSPLRRLYRDALYRLRQMVNPQTTGIQADWVYSYDAISEPRKQLN